MAGPVPTSYQLNDIMEIQLVGQYYGDWNMITMHFRAKQLLFVTGALTTAIERWVNTLGAQCSVHQVWHHWRHRRLRPTPVTAYGLQNLFGFQGAWSGEGMPHQIAMVHRLRTLLTTQSGRGRIYIPGVPFSFWQAGNWNGNALGSFAALKADWDRVYKVGGDEPRVEMGVVSRLTSPVIYNGLRSIDWAQYPGVQRSRRVTIF